VGKGMNFRKILEDMGLKVETDIIADDLISALNIFSISEGYFLREWDDLKNFFRISSMREKV
jgi:hypothetical protein